MYTVDTRIAECAHSYQKLSACLNDAAEIAVLLCEDVPHYAEALHIASLWDSAYTADYSAHGMLRLILRDMSYNARMAGDDTLTRRLWVILG